MVGIVLRIARSSLIVFAGFVVMVGTAACEDTKPIGVSISVSDKPSNGLIVSGAVTETVAFTAYSCPDELQGHVTSGGAGPVDLSYRSGVISFTDRDGTTYTGTGTFASNGSGGMTIDTDLKSEAGKTIHLRGGSPCK